MNELLSHSALVVQQKKEWGEILINFEMKNKFSIKDAMGNELYFAGEESGVIARLFLKMMRPFVMHIIGKDGKDVLRIRKLFRFYFHEAHIEDGQGRALGKVVREFSLFQRNFAVFETAGVEIYKITGPFLHPWTFHIRQNGADAGKILKRWSGAAKEFFTDADNFSVSFDNIPDARHRAVILGALFLIDILYFEQK